MPTSTHEKKLKKAKMKRNGKKHLTASDLKRKAKRDQKFRSK